MTLTPLTKPHPKKDWSGKKFAAPSPVFLTKAWQHKHLGNRPLYVGGQPTLAGQDAVTARSCTPGLPVYAGYFNGTFANLNDFRADFPSAAYILAISPNGMKGARCIDCEPGDADVAEAAQFVKNNLPTTPPSQGRNDQGKPMVYCSASDSQAVINAIAALGIARSQWILFSAHWIGIHICAPSTCGFPVADGTQYMDGANFDSDLFYAYCFGPVWPLRLGSAGNVVETLQGNLNKWAKALGLTAALVVDGTYGAVTEAAVVIAQAVLKINGPSGTCSQVLYDALAVTPPVVKPPVVPPVPPVPVPWVYVAPAGLALDGAGPRSVAFHFTAPAQAHTGLAKFQVVVSEGSELAEDITGYPRYIEYISTGTYAQQFGVPKAGTKYILGIRAMAQDGSHSSEWALLRFTTAKAAADHKRAVPRDQGFFTPHNGS